MKIDNNGINLIKKFEGCILHGYPDPATGKDPVTIGFGNTYYENGSKIKLTDKITQERAEELLLHLVPKYAETITKNIHVPLNQNQYNALISFCWNCGSSNTLFTMINNKSSDTSIYNWWITHYTTGGGKVMDALIKRRKIEAELFIKK